MAAPSEEVAAALKEMREGATAVSLYRDDRIGAEGARHLAKALKTNSTLQTLNLGGSVFGGGNDVGAEGARHLSEALKTNSTLCFLNLNGNTIGDEGARHLAEALKASSTLQSLDLCSNCISDEGARHLAEALKANSSLQSLRLEYPLYEYVFGGSNFIGAEGARHLSAALKTNSTLWFLSLGRNDIGNEGARHLAEVLKVNSSLQSLRLPQNSIGTEGTRHLADALETNRTLVMMDLNGNRIGDEGVRHLAEALKASSTLQSLDLGSTYIDGQDARHLAEALKTNRTLQRLYLENNSIGAVGARHVADALKTNSTLEMMDLSGNDIGNEGARHLAVALKVNITMQTLKLSRNEIGDEGAWHLAEALKANSALRWLDLSGNVTGDEGERHLAEALKTNSTLEELTLQDNWDGHYWGVHLVEIYAALSRNWAKPDNTAKWPAALAAAVRDGDVHPWGRAKLMVVGQGAAGKTSTVRSLLGEAPVATPGSTLLMEMSRTRVGGAGFRRLQEVERDFDAQVVRAAAARVEAPSQRVGSPSQRVESQRVDSRSGRVNPPPRRADPPQARADPPLELKKSVRKNITQAVSKAVKRLSLPRGKAAALTPQQPPPPPPPPLEDDEVARRFDAKAAQALHAQTKDGTHVSFTLWDYGGQEVFYALHHIFLTQEGLYVLVFDMRQLLRDGDEAGRYLRFWLNSIQLHAPAAPVLLVGTYLDEVGGDLRAVDVALRERAQLSQFQQVVVNAAQGLHFFPMDNASTALNRADALRAAIVAQTVQQAYVTRPVSLRWLRVQDAMLESGKPYFALADVAELCRGFGVPADEVDDMLQLFHGLGVVVHLTATEALDNVVVVDPQWLIDKLVKVVSDKMHVEHLYTDPELRAKGLMPDFQRLRDTGIASRELLQHLWGGEEVEYLLQFMQENLLLCEWCFGRNTAPGETFLATSLLSSTRELDVSVCDGGLVAELDFSQSFLPNGVFQRLVAQCATYAAGQADSMEPELSSRAALLSFGFSSFALVALEDRVEIRVEPGADSPPEVIKVLVSMLRGQLAAVFRGLAWQLLLLHNGVAVEYGALEAARKAKAQKIRATRPKARTVELKGFDAFFAEAQRLGRLDDDHDVTVTAAELAPLPRGIKYHAFLSHKQVPGAYLTAWLGGELERRGLKVWFDQAHAGELNERAMLDGVRASKCYVLVLTKDVFESAAVLAELKEALDAGKPIVLVHEANPDQVGVYAPFSAHVAALPSFAPRNLFNAHESLAVQRRRHLQPGFMLELIRRIDTQGA